MKRKEFLKEVRLSDLKSLDEKARNLAGELLKVRFSKVSGQSTKTHQERKLRRDIARVMTVRSEAVLSQAVASELTRRESEGSVAEVKPS